ncbi:Zn-ribbon domain-containing OB-fold protein [Nocardioides limicola]|uniref:Zn-ribbon domain-containing OB-fold protein n=1 Tax=Nocardioides limicola TaxID=2803368 RepID=UPI00193B9803|nr:OB-fold nucleic acid binding domain-containing protein [Nocardioides sp. DJM-14]
MTSPLTAPMRVSFDYTRSVGPVLSKFLTGLRDQRLIGGRLADGRVAVPPPEYDPQTHLALTEFVEVGQTGTVVTWSWVSEPVPGQPLDRPFAYALVLFDGSDTPMLHALDVPSADAVRTGMRVRVRWAEERSGVITDIACLEPADADADVAAQAPATGDGEAVTGIITPVDLHYTYAASSEESTFFRGLAEGRLIGQRCPTCHKVYVPPRGACPVDGVATIEDVELPHTGTVTTFCIVNVPFLGQRIDPPYVSAYVLLDGADIAIQHLILDIPADEVRMGMRVEAVWRPREEWGTTIENINGFRPTGEPDADFASFAQHL